MASLLLRNCYALVITTELHIYVYSPIKFSMSVPRSSRALYEETQQTSKACADA